MVQTAQTAKWENGAWVLSNGVIFTMDEQDGIASRATFSKQVIPLRTTPREISWEQKEADEMTLGELRGYIQALERQKLPTSYYWTEIFMRFAIPLASFVFALLGAPLGTQRQRSGFLAAMSSNIVCLIAGIILLKKADY